MAHADQKLAVDHAGTRAGGDGELRAAAARFALLPLRLFLGATFIYAGLDKLTEPGFFAASGEGTIGEMMHQVRDGAALPQLVDLALNSPAVFGYVIALSELAVGVGTLFGVLGRLSAFGGALISLTFWLTVSWSTTPYYYGNDLAYLMAWTPLLMYGTPYLSVDSKLAKRRRRFGQTLIGG